MAVERAMKYVAVAVVVAIVAVAILATAGVAGTVRRFEANCASGKANSVLCRVAETGGLFTPEAP
jgi:hypothetical protein